MRMIASSPSVLCGTAALVLLCAAEAVAQDGSSLDVTDAVLTTGVEDRQPVDTISTVPADVGQVYLWTHLTGGRGELAVAHVWYHRDQEMARVPVRIMGPSWRTWTSKRILPEWTGSWRVDVAGPDDAVLETVTFQVVEGGGGR